MCVSGQLTGVATAFFMAFFIWDFSATGMDFCVDKMIDFGSLMGADQCNRIQCIYMHCIRLACARFLQGFGFTRAFLRAKQVVENA